jgi:hypothetical protein
LERRLHDQGSVALKKILALNSTTQSRSQSRRVEIALAGI